MSRNVGQADRVIRIVAGLAILSLLVVLEGKARWFGLIGLVPLFTGIMGRCPAYRLLGINSCSTKGDRAAS